MSEAAPLQFEKAVFGETPSQVTCTACQHAIAREYFEVNGAVVCAACHDRLAQAGTQGSPASRFLRALGAGVAAGVVGSLIYFAIGKLTGYEFGLIAVLGGFGVGAGVRWGCYGRGGRLYQSLAVALTYLAIVSTYIPAVIEGFGLPEEAQEAEAVQKAEAAQEPQSVPAESSAPTVASAAAPEPQAIKLSPGAVLMAFAVVVLIAAVAPFFAGIQNIIGLVIIGVGLWEAWKMNSRPVLTVTGPHAVAAPSPAAAV